MDEHTRQVAERELDQLRQELTDLYETALVSIDAVGDPMAAFEVATAWQTTVRDLHEQQANKASRLRAQQAARIRNAEALSLAGLADRIGVSKARADQLVNLAKGRHGVAPQTAAEQAKEPEEATP
jgi:hypothetical protein